MRFEQLKNELVHLQGIERSLDKARTREWIVGSTEPDAKPEDRAVLIRTRVELFHDFSSGEVDTAVSMTVHRWMKDDSARCEVGDRKFTGGFFHFEMHPHTCLSSRQLTWLAAARHVVEQYISGNLEILPVETPPVVARAALALL